MRNLLASVIVTLILVVASPVVAQDLAKAIAANKSGDYATALREFTLLADQGDPYGQAALGVLYFKGNGVLQDYATAVKLWRLSPEIVLSQLFLAHAYRRGEGVPQDHVLTHMWLNLASVSTVQPVLGISGVELTEMRILLAKNLDKSA